MLQCCGAIGSLIKYVLPLWMLIDDGECVNDAFLHERTDMQRENALLNACCIQFKEIKILDKYPLFVRSFFQCPFCGEFIPHEGSQVMEVAHCLASARSVRAARFLVLEVSVEIMKSVGKTSQVKSFKWMIPDVEMGPKMTARALCRPVPVRLNDRGYLLFLYAEL
jgi:hypothetical protein